MGFQYGHIRVHSVLARADCLLVAKWKLGLRVCIIKILFLQLARHTLRKIPALDRTTMYRMLVASLYMGAIIAVAYARVGADGE
jgi:hypothetical protein